MTSLDPALFTLAGGALALGMGAAQIVGPVSSSWRPRMGMIHRRLRSLPRAAPPVRLRALGAVLVAGVLAGGTLAAYAAEPSVASGTGAAERLAVQAAGVVGSGDKLSLKLQTPQGERSVKVGETYEEGWTLQALTPTKATLAKDGATREVGLNPTGALASTAPAAPPSTVRLAGMPDEAAIQAYVDRALAKDSKALETARHGQALTIEEGRRRLAYGGMIDDEFARRMAGDGSIASRTLTPADQRDLLGATGYDDYWDLQYKVNEAANAEKVADLAARPFFGPTSYTIPAGAVYTEVQSAQGIDSREIWSHTPDAQGGTTVTLIASTPEQVAAYYQRTSRAGMGQTFITRPAAP